MNIADYMVFDIGLMFSKNDFKELIRKYYIGEDKKEMLESLEEDDLIEIMFEYFTDFNCKRHFEGVLEKHYFTDTLKVFKREEVYYLPLKKSLLLYEKYENQEEIFEEIKNRFEDMDLKFDKNYIVQFFGGFCGVNY